MKKFHPIRCCLVLMLCLLLSSCLKLQINPGDVVGDSVDAGKELYQTIKRKRNGEEERQYTNFVDSTSTDADTQSIVGCHQQIKDIIEASSLTLVEVLKESSQVTMIEGARKIQCDMLVLVVPE